MIIPTNLTHIISGLLNLLLVQLRYVSAIYACTYILIAYTVRTYICMYVYAYILVMHTVSTYYTNVQVYVCMCMMCVTVCESHSVCVFVTVCVYIHS